MVTGVMELFLFAGAITRVLSLLFLFFSQLSR
ncbi:hypothetical protein O203_00305 [Ectopseudomonas chengduensis]|nr:hypothetical protein O203_00305 [Pseudomonas chengduensis]